MTEFERARRNAVQDVRSATETAARFANRAAVLDTAARVFPAEALAVARVDGPTYQTQHWAALEFEFGRRVPVATAVGWLPPVPAQLELVGAADEFPKLVFRPRGASGATGYLPVAPLALKGDEVCWWVKCGDTYAHVVARGNPLAPVNLTQVREDDPRRVALPNGDDDPVVYSDLDLFGDGLDVAWAVTESPAPSATLVENFLYRLTAQAAAAAAVCGWKAEDGDPVVLLRAAREAVASRGGFTAP